MSITRLRALVAVCTVSLLASVGTPAAAAPQRGAADRAGGGACTGISETGGGARDRRPVSANLLRRCLRLNQVQVIGTHNSYRGPIPPEILAAIRAAVGPELASELEYAHVPLAEQLEVQEVRQIEIDVFADPEGGLYARRLGLDLVGLPNEAPAELEAPGFKVLHIQDLDFNSTCLTFVACLSQVEAWSAANPGHLPIAILVELKDGSIGAPFVEPVPIGRPELDALDAEIRTVFSDEQLLTPDDVRGSHPTLDEAVRAGAWPTLREAAGKVVFLMDNGGRHRDAYRAGRPSLEGRVLFTNSIPGAADGAFVKVNESIGNVARIQELVADGYVVRTRADVPTVEARSGDTTRRDAALASGAQWVSTDYPVPGSSPFSSYFAAIPGGEPARCNPVNTGPRCADVLLEDGEGPSLSAEKARPRSQRGSAKPSR